MIPKLMLGTSPFIGAGQFGTKAYDYRQQFFCNERNMTRLFIKSALLGVAAVQLIAYEPVINALNAAREELEADFFVAATIPSGRAFERYLELLKPLQPEIIAIHALSCDAHDQRITGWIKEIQAAGASPGAATHLPGETIPELDAAGFAFEVYLAPLNTVGYAMGVRHGARLCEHAESTRSHGKASDRDKTAGCGARETDRGRIRIPVPPCRLGERRNRLGSGNGGDLCGGEGRG